MYKQALNVVSRISAVHIPPSVPIISAEVIQTWSYITFIKH